MSAGTAFKRLMQEYRQLMNDPPEGISAGPLSDDDFFTWEAVITGPEGTPYANGVFIAHLKFPTDYPFACDTHHSLTLSHTVGSF
jgi:ubiquitin-conjugating enzyme E2 G2